jgi:hypothetical protein
VQSQEDIEKAYDQWAAFYDQSIADDANYILPRNVA